ncbi:DUF397 domain-containing protein [Actinoplanes auranticolor]|uniref:DUF397 domain-containing protein n=1 Tax=Actinoplanes auranticolor TaxID=47988 RepID=A0A919ST03_9ACTN|nr:DUF397 domain-containing protein [Actinoplanes auranticolor]GIM77941.1 hypothetical protein Aau02nite_78410 [Actinoplanes auranticolor]
MMHSTEHPAWRKGSKCANGTCVEIAAVDGGYLVRDSKRPEQQPMFFTGEELSAFAEGFVAGEFAPE